MKDLRMQHPRPQFIRDEWELLDGKWNFKFDDHDKGLSEGWHQTIVDPQTITVPYTYETQMSGINDPSHHPVVWYEKEFEVTEPEHYSLIFEGVDYICQVWLNGNLLGMHQGAYERFEFDLGSNLKEGTNKITMRIKDSMDCEQPRGKQRWQKDNFGCWYVQTTGIWKSVWLEKHLTQHRIENVKITPDIDRDRVIFEPKIHSSYLGISSSNYSLEIEVSFNDHLVNSYRGTFTHQMVPIEMDTRIKEDASWGTKQWSPETPHLYDVTFKLIDAEGVLLDEATSYFGMRKIHIKNGQVLLNNCQLYQRLILDQGYWPESGLTPPSLEALEKDIEKIFELGYNGLRKHQKIEDERFFYLCDKKGMLVWSEMPSTFNFNDIAITNFIDEWEKIVEQNYNHPSIITWVPFNESWGIKDIQRREKQQKFTEAVYYLTKTIDDTRPVITNDGWEHTISDIITLHDYEESGEVLKMRYERKEKFLEDEQQYSYARYTMADGYQYNGQPILISEFGGIAFATDNEKKWGYGEQVQDEEQFMKRFNDIHKAIQDIPYIIGYCYTQLTDVEQEVNGLLDPQRNPKVNIAEVFEINTRRKN